MRLHIIDAQDALIANPRLPRIGGSSVSAHKQSGLISQKNRENPAIVKEYELLDEYESQAHRLRQSGSTQQTARAANFASTVDQTYQVEGEIAEKLSSD